MSDENPEEEDQFLDPPEMAEGGDSAPSGGVDLVGMVQELLQRVNQLESFEAHVKENLFPQEQADTGTGDLFYVALSKTAGSDGNATAAPTYTYSGTVAGVVTTGLTPANRLYSAGRFVEASAGIGRYVSGSLVLVLAFEKKRTATC